MATNRQVADKIAQSITQVEDRDTLLEVGKTFMAAAKSKGVNYHEIQGLANNTFSENERGDQGEAGSRIR